MTVVWQKVTTATEKCDLGKDHTVTYWARKVLTETGETRLHDNGYEKRQTALATDPQGRTYHKHVNIDYFNNILWIRDEDKTHFYPRPHGNGVYRNALSGRLL